MVADQVAAVADAVRAVNRDALVAVLFDQEGTRLVRMARLFTDDRNAAEDIVQEAFIRLHRAAHRLKDPEKAAPYLRSIVATAGCPSYRTRPTASVLSIPARSCGLASPVDLR